MPTAEELLNEILSAYKKYDERAEKICVPSNTSQMSDYDKDILYRCYSICNALEDILNAFNLSIIENDDGEYEIVNDY